LIYRAEKLDDFYESIIAEEVNVKVVKNISVSDEHEIEDTILGIADDSVLLDKTITPELRREGLAREVIRHIQSARKNAGLNVDDRIVVSLEASDDELVKAIAEHEATITAETLATTVTADTYEHTTEVTIEGVQLKVSLERAA